MVDIIREKLNLLPDNPGVYIMQDKGGSVIYVGKARNLKNRVRQYFRNSPKAEKVEKMVSNIADFNYIITDSEIDALSLENNLIKKYKPKYNILLKDDKTYPYIKVDIKSDFPAFSITRKIKRDGARYFGPFMGGINCKDILEILQLVFCVRICRTNISEKPQRACINYQMGKCLAPCSHAVTHEAYMECVKRAVTFLEGDYKGTQKILEDKMRACAENENFEKALDYKLKAEQLKKLEDRRITSLSVDLNADIFAYATNGIYSAVNVLFTRGGIMQGGASFALEEGILDDGEAMTDFITSYYAVHNPPKEIICFECEKDLLSIFFKEHFGRMVEITNPKQGLKRKLLDMAQKNAKDYLEKSVDKIKHKDDMTVNACIRLQELLGLSRYPKRMECFDISNVFGVDKVGSMVVFTDGEPDRDQYRRFKIKTVEGADDFASLREMLRRRLLKLESDPEKFPKPDLIVIDGGKGQLSSVKEIFDEMGISGIDLISLAKREEEIFLPDSDESVMLSLRDYSLQVLQRLRDEAHRFAITYFRNLHNKRTLTSFLSDIPGIGKQKAKALQSAFPPEKILSASEEELSKVPGIGPSLAKIIRQHLDGNV